MVSSKTLESNSLELGQDIVDIRHLLDDPGKTAKRLDI